MALLRSSTRSTSSAVLVAVVCAACGLDLVGSAADPMTGQPSDAGVVDVAEAEAEDARSGADDAGADDLDASFPIDASVDAGPATSILSVSVDVTSPARDVVSLVNGPIQRDGLIDGAFQLKMTGPAIGVALLGVNQMDGFVGTQWDTWVGVQDVPAALGAPIASGSLSAQLGVEGAQQSYNLPDGTALIPEGTHDLLLFASNAGSFFSGNRFVVALEAPDHSVVRSSILVWP